MRPMQTHAKSPYTEKALFRRDFPLMRRIGAVAAFEMLLAMLPVIDPQAYARHTEPQPEILHLIDRPPEIMTLPLDRQNHLIHIPLASGPGAPATELSGILLAKLAAPLADAS